MSDRYIKLPDDLIKEWPEVFSDLHVNTLPVEYLEKLKIEFLNGRIWEISIKSHISELDSKNFSKKLISTLSEYSEEIKKIDFVLDTEKLKSDVEQKTKKLF